MPRRILVPALVAALAACSSERMQDPGVAEFRVTAQEVGSAAAGYQAAAAGLPDAGACTAMHAAYDDHVRPLVDRMRTMAGAMDAHMTAMGSHDHADMGCVAAAMREELDRHAAAACASHADMGPNVAEIDAHAGAMRTWAGHEDARCDELSSMMDGQHDGMHHGGTPYPGAACPPAP